MNVSHVQPSHVSAKTPVVSKEGSLRPEWMRSVRRQVSKNLWLHFVVLGEDPGSLGILKELCTTTRSPTRYLDIRTTTTCNHLLSRHKMYTNGCSSQVYCLVSWLQAIALCWCQGLRTCSGSRCDVVLRVLIICWLWF